MKLPVQRLFSGLFVIFIALLCLFFAEATMGTEEPPPPSAERPPNTVDPEALKNLDRSEDREGPDEDNNGIRDDVDTYITTMKMTPKMRKYALQVAMGLQEVSRHEVFTDEVVDDIAQVVYVGAFCLNYVSTVNHDTDKRYDDPVFILRTIEVITFNTKQRAQQYLTYSRDMTSGFYTESKIYPCESDSS